jgi:predicted MFS family arabinose efflux permease
MPASSAMRLSSLAQFARRAASRRSMLMIALVFVAHFGTYTYVSPLMQQAGLTAAAITIVLLGYGIAGFFANFIASYLIARDLAGSLLSAKVLMLVALAALPAAVALSPLLVALIMLWGIAWGALPLCLSIWNRNAAESDPEPASAMFTFTTQVAIAVGSGFGGVVVDHMGVNAAFWAGEIVVLLSAIVLVAHRPREAGIGGQPCAECVKS